MTAADEFAVPLPRIYRSREVLAFHGRDREGLAERVDGNRLRKAASIAGMDTLVEVALDGRAARCRVETGQRLSSVAAAAVRKAVTGMLGLHDDPGPFERASRQDPLLGPIVARQRGLRIPMTATPFEALSWAIIGQQINLPFAIELRRQVIRAAGRRLAGGLWCYPAAEQVAGLDVEMLLGCKFSRAKADTLIRVARLVAEDRLPLSRWAADATPVEEIEAALLAVKGIGPWTVNYVLLRGFGMADRSLHGDAAVRAALLRVSNAEAPLKEEAALRLLERYRPYRSYAAAHLWASLSAAP